MYQEYKAVNKDGFECFFFRHNGWSALHHAEKYRDKFDEGVITLYQVNERPYGARWLEVRL